MAPPPSPDRRLALRAARCVALAVAYALVARLGLGVEALGGLATLVWPPTGVALAALVVFGSELWPGVALGALIANLGAGAPVGVALGIACGNTLEAVLGATMVLRSRGFDRALGTLRSVATLVLVALGSTLVSATVGVASMVGGHVITRESLASTWLSWWLGDVIGALVVAPLLLHLSVPGDDWTRNKRWEATLLGLLLFTTVALVFGPTPKGAATPILGPFVLMPCLIWSAVRFGPRGATLSTFAASAGAVAATALQRDVLSPSMLHDRLLELQGFMAVAAVTFLSLGAAVAERRRLLEVERAAHAGAVRDVQARDDFLAMASHELRTPLTPLKLQLDGLIRAFDGDPELKDRLKRAARQTERLARLTDDLLDVSRISSGQLELDFERLDLGELVGEVVEECREDATRAGSALYFERPPPTWVSWDRARSRQVIAAMLSNAVRFGRGKPIELTLQVTGDVIEVTVRDHGVGIELEVQARIFERFERGGSARAYGGLGLGLYVAREIARAHGGDITLSSTPGTGSAFTLRSPRELQGRAGPSEGLASS